MLLKIFLTFWLAVALLAAGQEVASMMAQRDEQAALDEARRIVAEAQAVVDAYARGGVDAARAAAGELDARHHVAADLLDRRQRSLFGRESRPAVVAVARRAAEIAAAGSTMRR